MCVSRNTIGALVGLAWAVAITIGHSQTSETFSATATVKTAGGATATAPITVTLDRVMSRGEAETLVAAFTKGGVAGLRKALEGVPPTGSIRLGGGAPTATRLAIDRPTDKGRLVTIVADRPILFLTGGVPDAEPRDGYDFAVLDLEVDALGHGSGMLAPAARITVKQGVFVIDDYAADPVRLTSVKPIK